MFYAVNGIGIGHIARCLTIADQIRLINPLVNIEFATDSNNLDIITKTRYPATTIGLKDKKKFQEHIEKINPDIIVYDNHAPEDFTQIARKSEIKNILILRKYNNKLMQEFFDKELNLQFDKILFPHTVEELEYNKTPAQILQNILNAHNISFSGQITKKEDITQIKQQALKEKYNIKNNFVITVIAGGGGHPTSTNKFLNLVKNTHKIIKDKIKNLKIIVLIGPLYKDHFEETGIITERFEKKLKTLVFISDITICQSGYNTVNEIVSAKKPAIFVPVKVINENQEERLWMIKKYNLGKILIKQTPEELAELIINNKWINNCTKNLKKFNIEDGNLRAARQILSMEKQSETLKIPAILSYHSIGNIDRFSVTEKTFEKHIMLINKLGYVFYNNDNDFDFSITFDDGYLSFYEKAIPILEKHNTKATMFITTGFVGKKGYMNWDQIKEIAKKHNIGSHGTTHNSLLTLSKEDVKKELLESKKEIEKKIGKKVTKFAFPYGFSNYEIGEIAIKAGYKELYTGTPGAKTKSIIPRVVIVENTQLQNIIEPKSIAQRREMFHKDYPKILNLKLLRKCNSKCTMCNYWDKQAWPPAELENNKVHELIEEATFLGFNELRLSGGEPTLRKDLFEIIQHASDLNLNVLLSTNGLIIDEKYALKLRESGLKEIIFSLDSDNPKLNDKIRATKNHFKKTINAIKHAANSGLNVGISTTIQKQNYNCLRKIIPMLGKNINFITFSLVNVFIGKDNKDKILNKTELKKYYFEEIPFILRTALKHNVKVFINPVFPSLKGETDLGIDPLQTEQFIAKLLERSKFAKDITNFSKALYGKNNKQCNVYSREIFVSADGNIVPCCNFLSMNKVIGKSIYNNSLKQVLDSKEYNKFKHNAGKYPECKNCKEGGIKSWD